MSIPLAEYLSAVEARDAREQAHAEYIQAYTRLADRTAAHACQPAGTSPGASTKTIRPDSVAKVRSSPTPQDAPSAPLTGGGLAQIRAELASTQRIRSDLESKLSTQAAELETTRSADVEQKKRIAQLEKIKEHLERRVRDRADELKGKGRFVEEVQDEMVALNLQLNMAEQEKDKLKRENEELTRRWMEKMEAEATSMNDRMDKEMAGRAARRR